VIVEIIEDSTSVSLRAFGFQFLGQTFLCRSADCRASALCRVSTLRGWRAATCGELPAQTTWRAPKGIGFAVYAAAEFLLRSLSAPIHATFGTFHGAQSVSERHHQPCKCPHRCAVY
jgi:hypothetical protein